MNEEFFLERTRKGEVIRVQLSGAAIEQFGNNPGLGGWLVAPGQGSGMARVKWDGQTTVSHIHVEFLQEDAIHDLSPPTTRCRSQQTN